jgi:hypothetical protein
MAGNTVDIDGMLDAKGTYGLVRVVHAWTPQGYINNFVCAPWKNYRNPNPPVARTWSGIVPTRVVDHNDPKKMGRIQVQFFWQADGATHWARTISPHAGPDRGFMFMPEVGDEVAVRLKTVIQNAPSFSAHCGTVSIRLRAWASSPVKVKSPPTTSSAS